MWESIRYEKLRKVLLQNDCKLPDFRHRITFDSLYINDCCNPSWIHEELGRRTNALTPHDINYTTIHVGNRKEDFVFVS